MRCLEPFVDRESGERRSPGDEWETNDERGEALASGPLAVTIAGPGGEILVPELWTSMEGRELRTVDDPPSGARVVACLNVWNDLPALRETVPTWIDHVDRVIVVDGAYAGAPVDACTSTDGTPEWLGGLPHVEVVHAPYKGFWPDQVTKRNEYMKRLGEDEVGFIVDADEFVENAKALRELPPLDVGWCPYLKGIYRKPQNFPRLIAGYLGARYNGRHYWLETEDGRFVTDCQSGGADLEHVFVPVTIDNSHGNNFRTGIRRAHDMIIRRAQQRREQEAAPTIQLAGRESLRIAQIAALDAGMVVFRLHTAINSTTPHTSVMATHDQDRPYAEPRQYDLKRDRTALRKYLGEADVIHCHLHYQAWDALGVESSAPVVIHHHGTMYRKSPKARNMQDATRADVRLVSNPELLQYGDDLHFLPNPVPVARYRRLRERLYQPDPDGWFRVGHSPSKREFKGTAVFLKVMDQLCRQGLKVKPVLIEGRSHAECLRMKAAECDAFFDSFWLGMQCSGIEAGAMGIPVIAGDEDNRAYYRDNFHDVPYVFAPGRGKLQRAVEALASDEEYRRQCAERVRDHVATHHDYAAVTARYLDILDAELNWRRRLSLSGGGEKFLTR